MKNVLVFFSGGKDSFLTACKVVERGDRAVLVTFNNGSVVMEENVLHSVERLHMRYGKSHITYLGPYSTTGIAPQLKAAWWKGEVGEIFNNYPNLNINQVMCLTCQSSMWVCGIALAVANDIRYIATGYRNSDVFCTGDMQWRSFLADTAKKYRIELWFPVHDITNDYDIDLAMNERHFMHSVYEPKCMLGMPDKMQSDEARQQLRDFFMDYIEPEIEGIITHMIPIYKVFEDYHEHSLY